MPPAVPAPLRARRRLSACSSSDSSDDDSDDEEEKEALRKFAREMYIQMNPTESNPHNLPRRSMLVKKNNGTDSEALEPFPNKEVVLSRPSLFRNTSAPVTPPASSSSTPRMRWKRASLKVRTAGRVFSLLKKKTKRKNTNKNHRVKFAAPGTTIDDSSGNDAVNAKRSTSSSSSSVVKLERIRCIETLDEFLDEGLAADIWFSNKELSFMKRDAFDLAEELEKAMAIKEGPVLEDEDEYDDYPQGCFRGLEGKTEEGNWEAYKARKDVVNAVLDEQDRRSDALVIGTVSREVTKVYAIRAVERAARDARIAARLLQEPNNKPSPPKKQGGFRSSLKALFTGGGRPSGAHFK